MTFPENGRIYNYYIPKKKFNQDNIQKVTEFILNQTCGVPGLGG